LLRRTYSFADAAGNADTDTQPNTDTVAHAFAYTHRYSRRQHFDANCIGTANAYAKHPAQR
jgi:hypothetical protein